MKPKKLKRYRLKINPEKGSTVDFISQVENPAIEVGFLKFNSEELKIRPGSSETQQEWVSRCIAFHVKEGYEQKQAAAMCYSMWDNRNMSAEDPGNMDVFGYKTQEFQMCPGAQATFGMLVTKVINEQNVGMVRSAAQIADSVFRIEEDVIEAGMATSAQMAEVLLLVSDFKDVMDQIAKDLGETIDVSYMDGHIETVSSYLNKESLKDFVDACWDGYEPVGFKIKDGKRVPNCVPVKQEQQLMKVSFDFDGTLDTARGQEKAKRMIAAGDEIYVISARNDKENMLSITRKLGIPDSNVFATGSNTSKVDKVKQLNIKKHFDNNPDVVKNLGTIGEKFESYSDYPKAAMENAARGIKLNAEIGNKCATQIGKVRAQQIANGEPLSKETITRTYSYLSRASAYYKPSDTKACGTISYLLWGGEEMLRWAESKMNSEDFIKAKMLSEELEDKMELFGPVLIPDLPIYRNSETMGEYEIIFKEQDIKEIAMNFMKSGYQNNINLDHGNKMADSYVFESFISSEMMPNPKPYEDLPLGTWFVRMKVEDPKVWKDIKDGKRNGFSIEGIFEYMVEEFEKNYKQENEPTNKLNNEEKLNLEKMIKDLFKKIFTELSQELDEKAEDLSDYQKVASSDYKIEARQVGSKVEVVDAMGNLQPAPDGYYEFEDGFKFEVQNGLISSIDGVQEEPMSEVEEAAKKDMKKSYMDMLADYPWDQCMMDMQDQGYTEEQAKKICGSIRWKNMEEEKMAAIEAQKEIEFLKQQYNSLQNCVITKDELQNQVNEIKEEFKMIFEKFSKVPAEPSKVNKSQIAKDIEREKFEQFISSIRKNKK